MNMVGTKVYKHNKITFHIKDDKVAIDTGVQMFLIKPSDTHIKKRYQIVKQQIESGQINSLEDICSLYNDSIVLVSIKRDWW